jgi:outer membrane protein OmpA-like peptidoglycan-associated protein
MHITALLLMLLLPKAFAVNVQQYTRSNSLTFEMLEDARLEGSHVFSDFDYILTLGFSYVDEPLVIKSEGNSAQVDTLVPGMKNIHLGAGWYIKEWLQLGTTLNYSIFKNNLGESLSDFNDLDLRVKMRIYHTKRDAFSVMPIVTIPLHGGDMTMGDSAGLVYGRDEVLSDEGIGLGTRFIYERIFKSFQFVANLGYVRNSSARFVDNFGNTQIDYRQRILTGAGVYLPLLQGAGINLEVLKTWSAPFFNDKLNPMELHAGFSTAITPKIHFFGGLNLGNAMSESDGNDYRLVAGVKIIPKLNKEEITERQGEVRQKEIRVIVERPLKCEEVFQLENHSESITVLFARGDSSLSPKQSLLLLDFAQALKKKQHQIKVLKIQGHSSLETVQQGHPYTNESLSLDRAHAIESILLGEIGDSFKDKIEIVALSNSMPLTKENDFIANQKNRRSEILIELDEKYASCRDH